eukprot:764046-Hanusia_phi.AAC.9
MLLTQFPLFFFSLHHNNLHPSSFLLLLLFPLSFIPSHPLHSSSRAMSYLGSSGNAPPHPRKNSAPLEYPRIQPSLYGWYSCFVLAAPPGGS